MELSTKFRKSQGFSGSQLNFQSRSIDRDNRGLWSWYSNSKAERIYEPTGNRKETEFERFQTLQKYCKDKQSSSSYITISTSTDAIFTGSNFPPSADRLLFFQQNRVPGKSWIQPECNSRTFIKEIGEPLVPRLITNEFSDGNQWNSDLESRETCLMWCEDFIHAKPSYSEKLSPNLKSLIIFTHTLLIDECLPRQHVSNTC